MESRRSFLAKLARTAGVAFLAVWLKPRTAGAEDEDGWVDVGSLEDFSVGMPKVIKAESAVVVRTEDGVRAMSSLCTHRGCPVTVEAQDKLLCPCHRAAFNAEGKVLNGPAKRPLPELPSKVEDGRVWVKPKN